jgi:four helix bundle protein
MKTYKDLIVWQKSIDLVLHIYEITKSSPKEEAYVLIPQMRRSATSIPSNIAEGFGRENNKEVLRFLNISLSSLSELETQTIICHQLGYMESEKIIEDLIEIEKMLVGLFKYRKSIGS